MADFLVALADFDRRRGWEALGHANLFAFIRSELGLSPAPTYWRQEAARLLQRFPDLVAPLRRGELCLTTMAELAKVLTAENREAVLPRFLGISSREAKETRRRAAASRGSGHANRGDASCLGRRSSRRLAPPAALVTGHAAQAAPPRRRRLPAPARPSRARPDRSPSFATLGAQSGFRGSRRIGRQARRRRTSLRRPEPAPRQRQPPVHEEARGRAQGPRPLHPERHDGAGAGGGARPAPREAGQGARAGEEAADHARSGGDLASRRPGPTSTPQTRPRPSRRRRPRPARTPPDWSHLRHRRTGPREHDPGRRPPRGLGAGRRPLRLAARLGRRVRLDAPAGARSRRPWARWRRAETVDNLRVVCHAHNTLAARRAFGARCVERYRSGRRA